MGLHLLKDEVECFLGRDVGEGQRHRRFTADSFFFKCGPVDVQQNIAGLTDKLEGVREFDHRQVDVDRFGEFVAHGGVGGFLWRLVFRLIGGGHRFYGGGGCCRVFWRRGGATHGDEGGE